MRRVAYQNLPRNWEPDWLEVFIRQQVDGLDEEWKRVNSDA